jgi:peptidoglycan-associated lipoprotein
MANSMRAVQTIKFSAVLLVALSMGACANRNLVGGSAIAGAASPGTAQDFVVNVGDRVFFADNQTDLAPQATAVLDRQA